MALTKISTDGVKDDAISAGKIPANAVGSSEIADDAVGAAQIADDGVAQAAVADEAIDEARLQISNAGSNGQFLSKQSGNTGGLTWATVTVPDSDKIEEGNTSIETVDTGSDGHVKITTEGTEKVRVIADGKVGIGTNSPTSLFHVAGAGAPQIKVQDTDTAGGYAHFKVNNDALYIESFDEDGTTGEIIFENGTTEAMRIGYSGQLGIAGANYGTSGQVLTSGGASAAPSWTTISSAPTITATASGAISIGKAVKINSDGTVSVITGQSKSLGSLGTVTTMNAYPKGCYDSTNKRVFITYYDGDSNTYYSQIGTLSGTTVTWGTAVQHSSSTGGSMPKSPPHYNATKDRFISCTSEGSSNSGKIRTWSASGTTLTLQHTRAFPRTGVELPVMINVPGTARYGFFFKGQNNSNKLYGFVGELSSNGNSMDIGSDTVLDSNSCEAHHGCWVADKSFFFVPYTVWTHSGRMDARLVVDPGGTNTISSSQGYEVNPHNQSNQRSNGAICINGDQVLMNVYNTTNQSAFLAIWKPASQTSMGTQGTNFTLPDKQEAGTLIHADLYDNTDGAMLYHVFQYGNDSSNDYVRLNKFRIGADNSITKINDASDNSAENILESQGYNGFSVWHSDQKKLVSFTRDGDLHYQVNPRDASDIQDNGVAGFSSAGYSNGDTATINVVGNTVTQSGLTPGKEYFVTNSGGISQTASALKSVKAGVAVTSTSLLIQT